MSIAGAVRHFPSLGFRTQVSSSIDFTSQRLLNTSQAPAQAYPIDWVSQFWSQHLAAQADQIQALEDGWDGHGAPRPNAQIVAFACDILLGLARTGFPPPTLVPMSHGGVQAEWHTKGADLEVEFSAPYDASFLFEDHWTGEVLESPVKADHSHLAAIISKLADRT